MVKKILIAVDGSAHSQKAVEFASDLAVKYDSEIYVLYVVAKMEIPKDFVEFARVEKMNEPIDYHFLTDLGDRIIKKAEILAQNKGVRTIHSFLEQGDPAEKIVEFAKENGIDLLVLGSRGLGNMKGLLLGSVSSKVCHMAESTCITVK